MHPHLVTTATALLLQPFLSGRFVFSAIELSIQTFKYVPFFFGLVIVLPPSICEIYTRIEKETLGAYKSKAGHVGVKLL